MGRRNGSGGQSDLSPFGIVVEQAGALLVADTCNHRIRRLLLEWERCTWKKNLPIRLRWSVRRALWVPK
ncbi:MAG: hypothetical protein ACT4OL_01640 [Nitrospiraceae bacterium]